ncbi:hypothetical protein KY285_015819 [Solanum tuberosum]|nr:hypothetical protein KY285_015819 [Solanum tuberosum]
MRAAMKKLAMKNKRQVKFQYDPSSYALNFDDGNFDLGDRERAVVKHDEGKEYLNPFATKIIPSK